MKILTSIARTGKRTYKEDRDVSFPTKNIKRQPKDDFKVVLDKAQKDLLQVTPEGAERLRQRYEELNNYYEERKK